MKLNNTFSIVLMAVLFLAATVYHVPAQKPISRSTNARRAEGAENMDLSRLLARAGKTRRRGITLRPESGDVNATVPSFSVTPMTAVNLPVTGSGTLGRMTKWMGFTSTNSTIGDSIIYEDKFGRIGLGTDSPTSKLTVAGAIESTAGYKFPDATVQTTAFLPNQVVRSLNGLTGEVSLAPGANITLLQSGNVLTLAAPNALTRVVHNNTLTGDGTASSPLGVAVIESVIQPFTGTNNITFSPGEKQKFNGFDAVPNGKRLVVEHVSISCALPTGQRLSGVDVGDGGPGALNIFQNLVPVYLGDFPDIIGFTRSHFAMSQPIKLYIEQGRALKLQITRSSDAGSAGCGIAGSGFLVDVP